MDHDQDHPMNNANNNDNQRPTSSSDATSNNDNDSTIHSETYVFTGNGGPALLATMQRLVNRIIMRDQHSEQRPTTSAPSAPPPVDEDTDMHSAEVANADGDRSTTTTTTVPEAHTDATIISSSTTSPSAPSEPASTSMPSSTNEPVVDSSTSQNSDSPPNPPSANPSGRPIRPLPRPHSHFHAHTPIGVIDLFTFNVGVGSMPPPPPPGTATFTFNLGPEAFAGFEAMFLNHMQKEREPDTERAKTLLRGMQIVPEGLVRRLERAGGVPGGQGSEDHSSGCAVCWGPLLEEVEPGEWDSAAQKAEKEKRAAEAGDVKDKEKPENEDEFRGRIVALPCAHVYHAECLLPWFSRNTTCPTCRFDIDPESLTWNPQPPPTPPETEPPIAPDGTPNPGMFPFHFTREDVERANAAEAERFNTFITSIFGGTTGNNEGGGQSQPQPNQSENQPGGTDQSREPPQQPSEQNQASAEANPNQFGIPPPFMSAFSSSSFTAPSTSPTVADQSPPSSNPPQTYGPAPPPPPPPRLHGLPALFRFPPVPLFFIPTRPSDAQTRPQAQAQAQPQPQPQPQPESSPSPPQPAAQSAPTPNTTQVQPAPDTPYTAQPPPSLPQQQQHGFPLFTFPPFYPAFHVFPGGGTARPGQGQPPQAPNANLNAPHPPPPPYPHQQFGSRAHNQGTRGERRKWVPPEPVGRTLRQRVEVKERELGLRCDDVVCLFAPSDEDPVPIDSLSEEVKTKLKRRVQLHGAYDTRGRLCEHSFHPACLVASARVAGLDGHGHIYEGENESVDRHVRETDMDTEADNDEGVERELEISCPVCRADGTLSHKEWQEGVRTLQAT